MIRSLVFVPLLMVTGLAMAGDEPNSGKEAAAAAVDGQSEPEAKAVKKEGGTPEHEESKALTEEEAKAKEKAGPKVISGMSILGNQEAPKSLVIVPWKSSELGATIGIMPMLDDSRNPIDKEVFMRALAYYQLRSAGSE